MAKYMILFNSDTSASEQMASATPEQMQASMAEWMKWKEEAEKKVHFEWGMPLQPVNRVSPGEVGMSSSSVSGYLLLEGDSKETITELLKTHPHLQRPGAFIDVLEMLSMPGM